VTLTELLVVLSILGILAAVLVPAVGTARAKAREVQCSFNLQQIGMLTLAHVEKAGTLPSAGDAPLRVEAGRWELTPRRSCGAFHTPCENQTWGWLYQIAQLSSGNTRLGISKPDDCAVRGMRVPLFFCPENGPPWEIVNTRFAACDAAPRPTFGGNDYAGNWGTLFRPGDCRADGNGPFSRAGESGLRLDSITDGGSTTILAGDKRLNLQWTSCGRQGSGQLTGWTTGANSCCDDASLRPSDALRCLRQFQPNAVDEAEVVADGFGSSHLGGANFLFCDFHVQMISYGIDRDVLHKLGTISGGEYIDEF
jgi:prepilin-type processing-associated H-X9-DG protein